MKTKKAPKDKPPRSKLRRSGIGLIIVGFLVTLANGVTYGIDTVGRDTSVVFIALGLGAIALGLGFVAWALGRESSQTMRAMANLVFHEKIAIISGYLGKREGQVEHDRLAALEFQKWVQPRLKQEFDDLWQEFFERELRPIVVKIGGSTLGNHDSTLADLITLQNRGLLPVVVHGGGSKVTEWLERMNISTSFERGLRVTDGQTLQVVIAVLAGLVNKELVAAINTLGGRAIGLSGIDGGLIQAKIETPGIGYVGEVVKVNPESVIAVLGAGFIPVIAPGGFKLPGEDKDPVMLLNINGDVSASEIATALRAERLIYLTDVPGVQDGNGNVVPHLSPAEASSLIASGVIQGGMIPKVEACIRALSSVATTQIIDGRSDRALLDAVEGNGTGTTIEDE
jgi:acetylglutamate kinase